MILVRAPLRISFVGGGTDLPDFYRQYPGRVISATIDKFVYVLINSTPLVDKFTVKYQKTEFVNHPKDLEHSRVRAALLDSGISRGLEIGTFADLPAKTGLGSSSSFSVALMKGLYSYMGKNLGAAEAAEAAARLEIELVGEPIGKQDQYAAAFGGFNVFQFNQDESVNASPVALDYKKRLGLEDRLLLFFTGLTRPASKVLFEQKANIEKKKATLKEMADSVPFFTEKLMSGDYRAMGEMLHEGWLRKKSLASAISTSAIDGLYEAGMVSGAWGGKILGAGGGGCLMFLVPPEKKDSVRNAVSSAAKSNNLQEFKEIPVKFIQSGSSILFKGSDQAVLA